MQKPTREQLQILLNADPERFFALVEQLFSDWGDLTRQVALLQTRIKELEAQSARDSHNSNKPPSSDGLKRRTKSLRSSGKRKAGGQKGHIGQTLGQVDKPDQIIRHPLSSVQSENYRCTILK